MDSSQQLPDDFIQICQAVTAKRPLAVIDHILQHGFVTTEDLKQRYGYNHPPRAARDVRELGVPLETFRVTGTDGRKIAAYKFGDISTARFSKIAGRTGLSKQIKDELVKRYGCKCFIYLEEVPERELQIDHRVPFEVDGEPELLPENFIEETRGVETLLRGEYLRPASGAAAPSCRSTPISLLLSNERWGSIPI
ncbi:hypothetical protein NIES4071_12100 [Calothrix sp. NIES-4071]|nr:hypothetical protein NIES4071_12100 [Calothrix sp. NIES-4071]BAZ55550.1 hypothetical protein NIES4105_12060 [Calothrix sp. NIES-4105]